MPKFMIERNIPGAGQLTRGELTNISLSSCTAIKSMGPKIQWLESFVTSNKVYCIYIAPDEETIREHAKLGGFPADSVEHVTRIIDPTTAESNEVY
jgi:hypothetical protein